MSTLKAALLLLIVAAITIFALQNAPTLMSLVVLGSQTMRLPISVWVLGAIAAGAATTLITAGLFQAGSSGSQRARYARSSANRVNNPTNNPTGTPIDREWGFSQPPQTDRSPATSRSNSTQADQSTTPRVGSVENWTNRRVWSRDDWSHWGVEPSTNRDRSTASPKNPSRTPPIVDAEVISATPPNFAQPDSEFEPEFEVADWQTSGQSDDRSDFRPDYRNDPYATRIQDERESDLEDWEDWEGYEEEARYPVSEADSRYTEPNPPNDAQSDADAEDWEDWDDYQEPDMAPSQAAAQPRSNIYEVVREPKTRSQTGSIYSYSYRDGDDSGVSRTDVVAEAFSEPSDRSDFVEPDAVSSKDESDYRVLIPPYRPPEDPDQDSDWERSQS